MVICLMPEARLPRRIVIGWREKACGLRMRTRPHRFAPPRATVFLLAVTTGAVR